MTRRAITTGLIVGFSLLSIAAFAQFPINEEQGYAGYRAQPCDRCVPGVKPALSTGYWLLVPGQQERYPQMPWYKIAVNGRDTDLGPLAVRMKGQLMVPVTAAEYFGLGATRSALNSRLMTLAGGPKVLKIMLGSSLADYGEETVKLPVAPCWYDGRVYMPIEAIGYLMGWKFQYKASEGRLNVTTTAGGAAQALAQPGLTSVATESDRPTLKVVNQTGQNIVVVMEREGAQQMWAIPAGRTSETRDLDSGDYEYGIVMGEAQASTGQLTLLPRRAYTWTIGG